MRNKIQLLITSAVLLMGICASNMMHAQSKNSSSIQEVQLIGNDVFTEVRNLLMSNFDFTNQDYKQGLVSSEVTFEVSDQGKIINVHSIGDCENVNKEIESVLSNLHYRISKDKLNDQLLAYSFVMPIKVNIQN